MYQNNRLPLLRFLLKSFLWIKSKYIIQTKEKVKDREHLEVWVLTEDNQ